MQKRDKMTVRGNYQHYEDELLAWLVPFTSGSLDFTNMLDPYMQYELAGARTFVFRHRYLTSAIVKRRDPRITKYHYGGTKSFVSVCACTLAGFGVGNEVVTVFVTF